MPNTVELHNEIIRDVLCKQPELLKALPTLATVKDAPGDCLTCGGDPKGEWHAKFNAVKLQIASADVHVIDKLKKTLNAIKLRVSYMNDDKKRANSVIL